MVDEIAVVDCTVYGTGNGGTLTPGGTTGSFTFAQAGSKAATIEIWRYTGEFNQANSCAAATGGGLPTLETSTIRSFTVTPTVTLATPPAIVDGGSITFSATLSNLAATTDAAYRYTIKGRAGADTTACAQFVASGESTTGGAYTVSALGDAITYTGDGTYTATINIFRGADCDGAAMATATAQVIVTAQVVPVLTLSTPSAISSGGSALFSATVSGFGTTTDSAYTAKITDTTGTGGSLSDCLSLIGNAASTTSGAITVGSPIPVQYSKAGTFTAKVDVYKGANCPGSVVASGTTTVTVYPNVALANPAAIAVGTTVSFTASLTGLGSNADSAYQYRLITKADATPTTCASLVASNAVASSGAINNIALGSAVTYSELGTFTATINVYKGADCSGTAVATDDAVVTVTAVPTITVTAAPAKAGGVAGAVASYSSATGADNTAEFTATLATTDGSDTPVYWQSSLDGNTWSPSGADTANPRTYITPLGGSGRAFTVPVTFTAAGFVTVTVMACTNAFGTCSNPITGNAPLVVEDRAYSLSGGDVPSAGPFKAGVASTAGNGFSAITITTTTAATSVGWSLSRFVGDTSPITGTATFTDKSAPIAATALATTYGSIGAKTAVLSIFATTATSALRTLTIKHEVVQSDKISAQLAITASASPTVNSEVTFTLAPAPAAFLATGVTSSAISSWTYGLQMDASVTGATEFSNGKSGTLVSSGNVIANVKATYLSGGKKTARLRIYSGEAGSSDVVAEASLDITVSETASFQTAATTVLTTPTADLFTGRPVKFSATIAAATSAKSGVYYTFDAGDGSGEGVLVSVGGVALTGTQVLNQLSYTYKTPGTYTAKLRLYSGDAATDYLMQTFSFTAITIVHDLTTSTPAGAYTLTLAAPAANPVAPPTGTENLVTLSASIKHATTTKTVYWKFKKDSEYDQGWVTGPSAGVAFTFATNAPAQAFTVAIPYYAKGPATGTLYIYDSNEYANVLGTESVSFVVEDSDYAIVLDKEAPMGTVTTADSVSWTGSLAHPSVRTAVFWSFQNGEQSERPSGVDAANARNSITPAASPVSLPLPGFKYGSAGTKTVTLRVYDAATNGNLLRSKTLAVPVEDASYTIMFEKATPTGAATTNTPLTFTATVAHPTSTTPVFWSLERDTGAGPMPAGLDATSSPFLSVMPAAAGGPIAGLAASTAATANMLAAYSTAGTKRLTLKLYSASTSTAADFKVLRTATLDLQVENHLYTITSFQRTSTTSNALYSGGPATAELRFSAAVATANPYYTIQPDVSSTTMSPPGTSAQRFTQITVAADASTTVNVAVTYASPGSKTATVKLYSGDLATSSLLRTEKVTFTVEDGSYTLYLERATTTPIANNEAVSFTASVQHATSKAPVYWSFDDGAAATAAEKPTGADAANARSSVAPSATVATMGTPITLPTATYATAGKKTATLRIYDAAVGGTLLLTKTFSLTIEDSWYVLALTKTTPTTNPVAGVEIKLDGTISKTAGLAKTESYTLQTDGAEGLKTAVTGIGAITQFAITQQTTKFALPGTRTATLRLYNAGTSDALLLRTFSLPITVTVDPDITLSASRKTPAEANAELSTSTSIVMTVTAKLPDAATATKTLYLSVDTGDASTAIEQPAYGSATARTINVGASKDGASIDIAAIRYTKPGAKTLTMRAYDAATSGNLIARFNADMTIGEDKAYTLTLTPPAQVSVGNSASFTVTLSHATATNTLSCKPQWTAGGNEGIGMTVTADKTAATFTYGSGWATPGLKTVTINCCETVSSVDYLIRSISQTIAVESNDYTLGLFQDTDATPRPAQGSPVSFYGWVGHPSSVETVYWAVNWNDGSEETAATPVVPSAVGTPIVVPTHTFNKNGVQRMTLKVYNDTAKALLLRSYTSSDGFTLEDPAYTLDIIPSAFTTTISASVNFTATVKHAESDAPVFWEFYNGEDMVALAPANSIAPSPIGASITAIYAMPKVPYTYPGEWTSRLRIYSKGDGTGVLLRSKSIKITVTEDLSYGLTLVPSATSVNTSATVSFTATLTNSSASDAVWFSFNSGAESSIARVSIQPNGSFPITLPSKQYPRAGTYKPSLWIYSAETAGSLLRVVEAAFITVVEDTAYVPKLTVTAWGVGAATGAIAATLTASLAHPSKTTAVFWTLQLGNGAESARTSVAPSVAGTAIAIPDQSRSTPGTINAVLRIYSAATDAALLRSVSVPVHFEDPALTVSMSMPDSIANPVAGQAVAFTAAASHATLKTPVFVSFMSGVPDDAEMPLGISALTVRPAIFLSAAPGTAFTLPSKTYPAYAATRTARVLIWDSPVGGSMLRSAMLTFTVEEPSYGLRLNPTATAISLGSSVNYTGTVAYPETRNVHWTFDNGESGGESATRTAVAPSATGKTFDIATLVKYTSGVGTRKVILRIYNASTGNNLLRSAVLLLPVDEDTSYTLSLTPSPAGAITAATTVSFAGAVKSSSATPVYWSFANGETSEGPAAGSRSTVVPSNTGSGGPISSIKSFQYSVPGLKTCMLRTYYGISDTSPMRTLFVNFTVSEDTAYGVALQRKMPAAPASSALILGTPVMLGSTLTHATSGATVWWRFDNGDGVYSNAAAITPSSTGTLIPLADMPNGYPALGDRVQTVKIYARSTGGLLLTKTLNLTVEEDTSYTLDLEKVHPTIDPTTTHNIIFAATVTHPTSTAPVYWSLDDGTPAVPFINNNPVTPSATGATIPVGTFKPRMPGPRRMRLRIYKSNNAAAVLRTFVLPIVVTEELGYKLELVTPGVSGSVAADAPINMMARLTMPRRGVGYGYYTFNSGEPGAADTTPAIFSGVDDTLDLPTTTFSTPGKRTMTVKLFDSNDLARASLLRSARADFTVEDPALSLAVSKASPAADPQVNEEITLSVTAVRSTLVTTPIFCSVNTGSSETVRVGVTPSPLGASFTAPVIRYDSAGAKTATVVCYDAAADGGVVRTGSISLTVVPAGAINNQVTPVSLQVRLIAPFPTTPEALETFKAQFTAQMKRILNALDILIKRVYKGSIVVEFDANVAGDSTAANNAVNAFLANPMASFSPEFLANYQVSGVEAKRVDPLAAADDDNKKSNTGLIVGLVVGLVGGAIIITLAVLFIIHRRRNNTQTVTPTSGAANGGNACAGTATGAGSGNSKTMPAVEAV